MATASTIQKLHRSARPFARCEKRSRQSKQKRTAGHSRNGFLDHQFTPFAGFYVRNWQKAEKEFFTSVTNICQFYFCKEPDVSALSFPLNIQSAYKELSENLKLDNSLCLKIMQDNGHDASLATTRTLDTGYKLFYIPIKPVCRLSSFGDTKILSKLMIAVYQYFYQIVDIQYYREPCYLNFIYETLENWINEEEDAEDEVHRKRQRDELENMKTNGDSFLRTLKQPFHLRTLKLLLEEFRKSEEWTLEADLLVQEILKLAIDYPKRSIQQSIPDGFFEREDSDLMCLEHYLSFYWSEKDGFEDVFFDIINNELQEMGYQEEPIAVQFFDKPQQKEYHNFDFENRLFAVLNELVYFITQYDHEEY